MEVVKKTCYGNPEETFETFETIRYRKYRPVPPLPAEVKIEKKVKPEVKVES